MNVTFFGTGAMASLFAARFALAGVAEVSVVGTWGEAVAAMRRDGIRIEDASGVRVAGVRAAFPDEAVPRADLAVVLVKSWQTPRVAGCLGGKLKPGGVALTLQNGLGNVEALGVRAWAGVTSEGATSLAPGVVAHRGAGETCVAAPDGSHAGLTADAVAGLFRRAGFAARACSPERAEGLVWGKLAVNCGINALTALCGATNGELLHRRASAALMERAASECAAVARARGIALPFDDAAAAVRAVARRTAGNRSSMLQDVARGAQTECDAINGAVAREGRRLGVPVPVNEALWRMMLAHPSARG
ncbi:MAG: 2-dehydropantoate 2-reductase [Acidobacteriota bacterium]|jgi:2-dehydropantoate 2-reductase|nr:2-dehydropantoate 2-reductase [Acidobacteriota bacterium]